MKINIIGRGRGAGQGLQAAGEKWTVNRYLPGADLVFDMHVVSSRQKKVKKLAAENNCLVMDLETYPIDRLKKHFNTEFFENSICYMLAYAISLQASEIDMYGCAINPQPGDTEIICKTHEGVGYWIGRAEGQGIKVKVLGDSMLLRCKDGMYGYREQNG